MRRLPKAHWLWQSGAQVRRLPRHIAQGVRGARSHHLHAAAARGFTGCVPDARRGQAVSLGQEALFCLTNAEIEQYL